MSENKFWLSLWLGICLTIIAIVTILCAFNYKENIEFARLGYEEVTIVGSQYTVWQKPHNNCE